MKITKIEAIEILDSRGNPTVQVTAYSGKISGTFGVPSGKSVGVHEALELRDKDPKRYMGQGVKKAVKNVNEIIAPKLKGKLVTDQEEIDLLLIALDGTVNKEKLGANAILGVSMAVARLAANVKSEPLHKYLSKKYRTKPAMPVPLCNIINGGEHADNNLDIQEYIIIPKREKITEMLRKSSEVFHHLGKIMQSKGMDTDVGNEGGYAPDFENNKQVFEIIHEAIRKAGYTPGKDFGLGIDAGASTFFLEDGEQYYLKLDRAKLTRERLLSLYKEWATKYNLISLEDGYAEDDLEGWKLLTKEMGKKTMLIGDDLFVTNVERISWGLEEGIANAVLVKPNQIGTLSETIEAIKLAQKNKYKVVISHRSGETIDSFISDLAYAFGAEYVKIGSLSRGERLAKYNRLLEIEQLETK
jgi:enolase